MKSTVMRAAAAGSVGAGRRDILLLGLGHPLRLDRLFGGARARGRRVLATDFEHTAVDDSENVARRGGRPTLMLAMNPLPRANVALLGRGDVDDRAVTLAP
jgi:hypothetical protein